MIDYARRCLRWLAGHPWLMAWVAFAKGAILGAWITAAVYRGRERVVGETQAEQPAHDGPPRPDQLMLPTAG